MPKQRSSVKGLGKQLLEETPGLEEHPVETFVDDADRIIHIPLDAIRPNPDQPRKHFREESLQELADSIRDRGLLQPVIVKREGDTFLLLAGERRYRAAQIAGLPKIPCLIRTDDPLEIAIIENLQREDLNAIEEAEGLQTLRERFDHTHVTLSKIVGKSRSTLTEILSLTKLPDEVKDECRTSDNWSKSQLLQVVRAGERDDMLHAWQRMKRQTLTTRDARKARKPEKRPPSYQYQFKQPDGAFSVRVKFRQSRATTAEVVQAIQAALEDLEEHGLPE